RTALAISPATSANQRRCPGATHRAPDSRAGVAGAPWRRRRPRSFRGHPVDERSRRRDCMRLRKVGAIALVGVLALAGCTQGGTTGGKGTIKVGIDLPLQGSELARSQPVINGAQLARKQAKGTAGGYTVEI